MPHRLIGRTADFGSVSLGSSPSGATNFLVMNKVFKSGTNHKPINLIDYIIQYLKDNPETKIYVGTDSQNRGPETIFATAIVLRYRSRGCHVIYHKIKVPIVKDIWSRLWREAEMSLETALFLTENSPLKIESIDLDFNEDIKKASNKLISATKGWIHSAGYKVTTKPSLQVATRAADHIIRN
jgi:predicted RNase H-related nuclease YkuK (DUF458 family)